MYPWGLDWVGWKEHLGLMRHWLRHVHPTFSSLFSSLILRLPSFSFFSAQWLFAGNLLIMKSDKHWEFNGVRSKTPYHIFLLLPFLILVPLVYLQSLHAPCFFSFPLFVCCPLSSPPTSSSSVPVLLLCWFKPLLRPYRNIIGFDSFHQISTISPGIFYIYFFIFLFFNSRINTHTHSSFHSLQLQIFQDPDDRTGQQAHMNAELMQFSPFSHRDWRLHYRPCLFIFGLHV